MSYLEKENHDVKKERERLQRLINERIAIEELMKQDKNHKAVREEIASTDKREVLSSVQKEEKKVNYTADGRSYFAKSRFMLDTSDLGPKYDVTEMLESERTS